MTLQRAFSITAEGSLPLSPGRQKGKKQLHLISLHNIMYQIHSAVEYPAGPSLCTGRVSACLSVLFLREKIKGNQGKILSDPVTVSGEGGRITSLRPA